MDNWGGFKLPVALRKETMFIYFTLITFTVYEWEQNFCTKFGRSLIQWKNIDSERDFARLA